MLHIIIENEAAYHFCRGGKYSTDDITWHTTSPWLLEKLPRLKEKVLSLEEDIPIRSHWNLGYANIYFSDQLWRFLDKLCAPLGQGILLGKAIRHRIQFTSFVLIYKAMLLHRWYRHNCDEGTLAVVGDLELSPINNFDLLVGRFDNLFVKIAAEAHLKNIKTIPHHPPSGKELLKKISRSDAGNIEKTLYFMNKNLSEFTFFVWGALQRRNVIRRDVLKFGKKRRFHVLLVKKCNLLSETFLPLLLKGIGVVRCDIFPEQGNLSAEKIPFKKEELHNEVEKVFEDSLSRYRLVDNDFYTSTIHILTDRIYQCLQYGMSLSKRLPQMYKRLNKYHLTNFAVATNGLTSPEQRVFQQYLVKKRIPIFSFEHGVTAGIDGETEYYHAKNNYTEGDDFMVCYNESSLEAYTNGRKEKGGIVAGAPWSNKKIPFYKIQRLITRNFLKLKYKERVIFYLALITRNNMVSGPLSQNDFSYYKITKNISLDVFSSINDTCILKLYPSNRYLDPDPFETLVELPSNVKIIQYFEFKSLRATADVIILSSAQSTFGWAWSANCPIIFLELPAKPLMKNVVNLFDRALFRIDGSKEGWQKEMLDLLKLPHKDLLKLWENKRAAREELEIHIFGPKGNSGKRAADFIAKEIRKYC